MKFFRNALIFVGTVLLLAACSTPSVRRPAPEPESPNRMPREQAFADGPTLVELSEREGVYIGAAVDPLRLGTEIYADTLKTHFNYVTPENAMKLGNIHPQPDTYDFGPADRIVEFARENGMKVRGHALVWHSQNAGWLDGPEAPDWTRDELIEVMREHIFEVAGRYKDDIFAWDVVNEALDGGNYRASFWYNTIGPEYIAMAFRFAHEAAPNARLYYNDYGIEVVNAKSDKMYEMVTGLLEDGVPIHGVGLQTHLILGGGFNFESFHANIQRFMDLGLFVDLTEIDIRIQTPVTDEELAEQGRMYKRLAEVYLSFATADTFVTWGVTDRFSWIPYSFEGFDEPLLFDRWYDPKPAFFSTREALEAGRGSVAFLSALPASARYPIPAFVARQVSQVPRIDGVVAPGEWDQGIVYPLVFNQLNTQDQRPPASANSSGTWTVVYSGKTIYGKLTRIDDTTNVDAPNDYENDNFEVFFDMNGTFTQLRSLVGQDFRPNAYEGNQRAVWSDDGTVMEFQVDLPDSSLAGMLAGWNVALSDNDGAGRVTQLYPIPGINDSYQGLHLGSIKFEGNSPRMPEAERLAHPFQARYSETIVVDGRFSEAEWSAASRYPLGFDQANQESLLPNSATISGEFGLAYNGNKVFGYLKRNDDATISAGTEVLANDGFVVWLRSGDSLHRYHAIVGSDFSERGDFPGTAIWSSDATTVEFEIVLPRSADTYVLIGFNIALLDSDGASGVSAALYPTPGSPNLDPMTQLGELEFLK